MSLADNSSTNSTELSDELLGYSEKTFDVITISLTFFSVVLFPFYAYLNIINRPQDSQRAVFLFLNFFFKTMCFTVVGYAFALSHFAVLFIKPEKTLLFEIGNVIILFTLIVNVINMLVCQLLTSILAFHRFLIYFSPKIGDFLTPGKKVILILICLLYSGVVVGYVITARSEVRNKNLIVSLYFVGLGLSELLISIPYTFMFLSIRKLTHLASAIHSRPEKYIAYQIVIAFVFKMVSLLGVFSDLYFFKKDLENSLPRFMLTDMFTFPLSVQLAYILSNKKNVDTLIAVITGKVMFWKNRARVEVENSTRF